MIREDSEETVSKYNYPDAGIIVTTERLVIKTDDSERSLPLEKINGFYVYPKRKKFFGEEFVVFGNVSGEEDFEVVCFDEKEGAVGLKDELNGFVE